MDTSKLEMSQPGIQVIQQTISLPAIQPAAKGGRQKGIGKKMTKKEKKGYQKVTENEKKGYQKVTEKESEWPAPFLPTPFWARWQSARWLNFKQLRKTDRGPPAHMDVLALRYPNPACLARRGPLLWCSSSWSSSQDLSWWDFVRNVWTRACQTT